MSKCKCDPVEVFKAQISIDKDSEISIEGGTVECPHGNELKLPKRIVIKGGPA